jgi:hypothetical protein
LHASNAPLSSLSIRALARGPSLSLLLNAFCPWAAFQLLTAQGVDSVSALVATAAFPVGGTLVGWVRSGRPDILGVLSLLFIGLSVAVALATDNELVILLRRSVLNTVFGILCFGSLALSRPLMFYIARQFVAGWDRSARARFDAQWQRPGVRRVMRRITVAWGCWLLAQAAGRVLALQLLPISTFLAIWPIVSNGGTFAMIYWSMTYARHTEDTHEFPERGHNPAGRPPHGSRDDYPERDQRE